MINISSLFLAQNVTTMQNLMQAVGHALGIVVVISYAYAAIMIIMACIQERGDGTWKYALARGIALFGATGIANILFAIFFPGQVMTINFN